MKAVLGEKDLEIAEIVKSAKSQGSLAGVKYLVIGSVSVMEGK